MGTMVLHDFWAVSSAQDMGIDRQRFLCRGNNYWWRWIYLFDVDSIYWNAVWSFFVLLGGFSFLLGMKLLEQRKG